MKITYTRKELMGLKTASLERNQEVLQTLVNKLSNKEILSLAESKFVCLALENTYPYDPNAAKIEIQNFSQCADFIFLSKYLMYFNDIEGLGVIRSGFNSFVSNDQKKEDVKLLNDHYIEWKAIVYGQKHSSQLLQFIAVETIALIKEVIDYSKRLGEGSNRHKHIEKLLTLFSKYVYYQIKEYYEELGKVDESMELCGSLVIVNQFAYVHILLGHFAGDIMYRPGQTYHRNNLVDFKNIPKDIFEILNVYNSKIDCKYFDKQKIFFNFKNQDYAIWFRTMKRFLPGKIEESYLRVQTFYPVGLPADLNKIKKMTSITINDMLTFYVNS